MGNWGDAVAEALGIVLPVECVGCGRPDRALCTACRGELDRQPGRVRLVAGVRCDAAFEYGGLARTLVLAVKVHGRTDLAGPLGRATGRVVRRALEESPPGTMLVRVPSSVAGRRRRGFDPVALLLRRGGIRRTACLRRERERQRDRVRSRGGAGASGVAGAAGPLDRGGAGAIGGQKSLTALERVAATVGTLRAVGVAGRSVVLVDDVVTTGVTMAEAVRAVRAAGGTVVRCVATASVEPPTPLEGLR